MKFTSTTYHIVFGFFGLILGFSLTRIGFADYTEVHRMFAFLDLRLFLTFIGAVVITMIGYAILAHNATLPPKRLHRGTIAGGVLFGMGWAVTGACPAVALVQLGAGYLPGLATAIGIALGVWSYLRVHARFFRWDTGACQV